MHIKLNSEKVGGKFGLARRPSSNTQNLVSGLV
jgi:hypothetical protein